jgi:hypothetical protein
MVDAWNELGLYSKLMVLFLLYAVTRATIRFGIVSMEWMRMRRALAGSSEGALKQRLRNSRAKVESNQRLALSTLYIALIVASYLVAYHLEDHGILGESRTPITYLVMRNVAGDVMVFCLAATVSGFIYLSSVFLGNRLEAASSLGK